MKPIASVDMVTHSWTSNGKYECGLPRREIDFEENLFPSAKLIVRSFLKNEISL